MKIIKINVLKKLGIITIVSMFLLTSMNLASAKNKATVVLKGDGDSVTEYFSLCYIEYKDYGISYGMCFWLGKHILNLAWIDCDNGTVTIRTPRKTLTIEGHFHLIIRKELPLMRDLFNLSPAFCGFIGSSNMPTTPWPSSMHSPYWLKGIARGVEITYYPAD